jgi:hypothetical protein
MFFCSISPMFGPTIHKMSIALDEQTNIKVRGALGGPQPIICFIFQKGKEFNCCMNILCSMGEQ